MELTDVDKFCASDIIFKEPKESYFTISGGKNMSYKRVHIAVKYPSGKEGPLLLITDRCFSFGVQEDNKFSNKSYSMPIVMYDKTPDGKAMPTVKQVTFVRKFRDVIEICKQWLVEKSAKVGRHGLEMAENKKFGSALHQKSKKGNEENSPVFYAKLIYNAEQNKFLTYLYEYDDIGNDETKWIFKCAFLCDSGRENRKLIC
jgi:hypothetical protein